MNPLTVAGALALHGQPPLGLGLIARSRPDEPGPWRWRTGREWVFVGVEASGPTRWERSLEEGMRRVDAIGARGIIFDPENGWTREGPWEAFGRALRDAALQVRVGVTSFPSIPGIDRLFAAAGRGVWGSPQLYFDATTNARGWERWRSMCGGRCIPTLAGYVRGPRTTEAVAAMRGSAEGYQGYVDSMPIAPGAMVWPVYPMPDYMKAALARRYGGAGASGAAGAVLALPGARTLISAPGAALALVSTWSGLALLALVLLFVGVSIAARAA